MNPVLMANTKPLTQDVILMFVTCEIVYLQISDLDFFKHLLNMRPVIPTFYPKKL